MASKGAAIQITAPTLQNKRPIYRIQDPGSDGLLVANSGTSTMVDEALGDNTAAVTNAEANGKELLQEGGVHMENQELGLKLGLDEGVAPMGEHGEESELDSDEVERELERFGMSDVESAAPSVDELAAISEASRRSKRQAETADEVCLDKAEKLKASRLEGDTKHPNSFLNFSDDLITSNYSSIGISLGGDFTSVKGSIDHLKKIELDRMLELHVVDKKN